jgi:hypothetical protein
VNGNPLIYFDPDGLDIICWPWGCKGDAELPPTDRIKPDKPKKPKRPTCAESTTNFASCMACCNKLPGHLRSGVGGVCAEQCMQKQGITQKDDEINVCRI